MNKFIQTKGVTMTNTGTSTAPPADTKPSTRFGGLDTALVLVTVVGVLMFVLGIIVGISYGDPASFMVAGMGLTTIILAGLGRVVIQMAQTLDRVSADARELRGIAEWSMRQNGS